MLSLFINTFLDISQSSYSNKEKSIFDCSDDSDDVVYDSDKDSLWKIDNGQSNVFYNILYQDEN